jgi:hypothetical protein
MPVPVKDYPICGSYNNLQTPSIDCERSINIFEYVDKNAKKPQTMLPTSGLLNSGITFPNASGGFRRSFLFNGFTYHVIGDHVYKVSPTNVATLIGTIVTQTGYVGMDANVTTAGVPYQIMLVDGNAGYTYDTTNPLAVLTKISDSNFPPNPIDCCTLDNFFVVIRGGTPNFQLSQLGDGTNWTPAQIGTVSTHPGTLVACRTLHRRLFLFTAYFTEVWENAGLGTNLPFRRNNSLLLEYGTPSPGSISVSFDIMCFLSQTKGGLGPVMYVQGTQAIPISTPALDAQFNIYNGVIVNPSLGTTGVSDAWGELVKDSSFIFYRLSFTSSNATYVYNVTMSDAENKRWHEEQDIYGNRSPGQTSVYINGNLYYGSFVGPILYLVSSAFRTNDGQMIPRIRIGKPICPEGYQRIRIDRFQLDLLQGQLLDVDTDIGEIDLLTESSLNITTESNIDILIESGNTQVLNANPVVFLSYSKDGGQSFGPRYIAPMGSIGQRTFRTVWRKLGVTKRGQSFVPKIEFFNEVPFVILGAAWGYEVLPE